MNFSSLFKKSGQLSVVDGVVMSEAQLSRVASPLSQQEISNIQVNIAGLTSQMI